MIRHAFSPLSAYAADAATFAADATTCFASGFRRYDVFAAGCC